MELHRATKATEAAQSEKGATTMTESIMNAIRARVGEMTGRSAWEKGVAAYALELLDELEEAIRGGYFDADNLAAPQLLDQQLLNGASDWSQYSWGGCSLIYDGDIAARLCCPSELKKTHNGERRPNASEEWLDTQARALHQAAARVKKATRYVLKKIEVA